MNHRRRRFCALLIVMTASNCGNDVAERPDAPMPGTPVVTIYAPRLNQAFYMTQTAQVVWSVSEDGASTECDVFALDGTSRIDIALDVRAFQGLGVSTPWTLTAVAPFDAYVARVQCRDDNNPPLVGTATSSEFAVVAPPQPVSYAAQVQPIWTASCTSNACHDSTIPQERLNLTPSASRAALVGVASQQCPTTQLVNPGSPDQSYIMFKLQGNGPCMTGGRMPKASPILSVAQRNIIRDWIANGAPDN